MVITGTDAAFVVDILFLIVKKKVVEKSLSIKCGIIPRTWWFIGDDRHNLRTPLTQIVTQRDTELKD